MSFNIISQKVKVEGILRDTYGIVGNDIVINDLSTNKNKVQSFVNKLNRTENVSKIHISDLVEDFLNE